MPTELQAKFRQLAGATVPCAHPKLLAWDVPGASRDCEDCKGTGCVYLFDDSVRVLCQNCHGEDSVVDHYFCNGTGCVPSEDGWVWIAATATFLEVRVRERWPQGALAYRTREALIDGNKELFFQKLLETVQTVEGVQLG